MRTPFYTWLQPLAVTSIVYLSCSLSSAQVSGSSPARVSDAGVSHRADDNRDEIAHYVNQPVGKSDYILGQGDRLSIHVFGADDLPDRPIEVSAEGDITAPLLGHAHVGGMSVHELEASLTQKYGTFFKDPEVTVTVVEYRSQPVTVVGSVNAPGVIQLRRPTRLMEVISQAGGLRADAGDRVLITRKQGDLGSPGHADKPGYVTKEIDLRKIIEGKDAGLNVVVRSDDLITVPKAKMVYVVGEVGRPGGYVLDGHSSTLSVLQAIALAGGVNRTARTNQTRILHAVNDDTSHRSETEINLQKILASRAPDVELHADDILFVPNSAAKNAGLRALQAAAEVGTGLAIWRF